MASPRPAAPPDRLLPQPPDWSDEEIVDLYGGRSWFAPVIIGTVTLILLAILGVGIWLIYANSRGRANPAVPAESSPTVSVAPSVPASPKPTDAPQPVPIPPTPTWSPTPTVAVSASVAPTTSSPAQSSSSPSPSRKPSASAVR